MFSTDSLGTVGTGLFLGGGVLLCWGFTSDSWNELRHDWTDFRKTLDRSRANKQEREAFTRKKACSRGHVQLNPHRLYRAVRSGDPDVPVSGWVYRCECGESTLYDAAGKGRRLEPACAA